MASLNENQKAIACIEDLLGHSLDDLVKMDDAEIMKFLKPALDVVPPVNYRLTKPKKPNKVVKIVRESEPGIPSAASRLVTDRPSIKQLKRDKAEEKKNMSLEDMLLKDLNTAIKNQDFARIKEIKKMLDDKELSGTKLDTQKARDAMRQLRTTGKKLKI